MEYTPRAERPADWRPTVTLTLPSTGLEVEAREAPRAELSIDQGETELMLIRAEHEAKARRAWVEAGAEGEPPPRRAEAAWSERRAAWLASLVVGVEGLTKEGEPVPFERLSGEDVRELLARLPVSDSMAIVAALQEAVGLRAPEKKPSPGPSPGPSSAP